MNTENASIRNENQPSCLGAVRRSALKWWSTLSNLEKSEYEEKMFGYGEWWEDNSLNEDDIVKMHQHYA